MRKRKHPSARAGAARRRSRGLTAPFAALAAILVIAAVILFLLPRNALPAEVDVVRAHAMYEQGALLVDVRTQVEWDEARIPGSVLIPLDELPGRLNELPGDRDIVVVCRSGNRSEEGTAILREAGFERVTCMRGGLREWAAKGFPLEH